MTQTYDIEGVEKELGVMKKVLDELRVSYMENAQGIFHRAIRSFFDSAPSIKAIWWNQYTPYFNDGEECVFEVNEVCYAFSDKVPDINDMSDGSIAPEPVEHLRMDLEKLEKVAAGNIPEHEHLGRSPYHLVFDAERSISYESGINGRWPTDRWTYTLNSGKLARKIQELRQCIDESLEFSSRFPTIEEDIKRFEHFRSFFEGIDADTMKDLFGDHVMVMLTRDGITMSDFEHE